MSSENDQQKRNPRRSQPPKRPSSGFHRNKNPIIPKSEKPPGYNFNESFNPNECFVCCQEISIFAIGVCDHPVCFVCSTRLRVLCGTKECPTCRGVNDVVYFMKEKKRFVDLEEKFPTVDNEHGIFCESDEVEQEYKKLLVHECYECIRRANILKRSGERAPIPQAYESFDRLQDHVADDHRRYFCELCVEHLTLFTFERHVYSKMDLRRHMEDGDFNDKSHKGHPQCNFCREHYLDKDTLFNHLRKDHFTCFLCQQNNAGSLVLEYFANYDSLKDHFKKDHILCEIGDCGPKRFMAFNSDLEYKAHFASNHSDVLSKEEQRAARNVVLDFPIMAEGRTLYDADGRRARRERRRPQERDPPTSREEGIVEEVLPPAPVEVNVSSTTEFPSLMGSGAADTNKAFVPIPQYGRRFAGTSSCEEFPSLGPPAAVRTNAQNSNWSNFPKRSDTASMTNNIRTKTSKQFVKPQRPKAAPDENVSLSSADRFPSLPEPVIASDFGKVLKPLPKKEERRKPPASEVLKGRKGNSGENRPKETKQPIQKSTVPMQSEVYERSKTPEEYEWSSVKKKVHKPVKEIPFKESSASWAPKGKDPAPVVVKNVPKKVPKSDDFPSLGPAAAKTEPLANLKWKPKYTGLKPGQAAELAKKNVNFVQPVNAVKRGNELLGLIKLLLNGNADCVSEYRSLLGDLKKGQINGVEFVEGCLKLFPDGEEFAKIFLEIVYLLPDVSIQNELIIMYDDLKSRFLADARRTKDWSRCSSCGQILDPTETQSHARVH